MTSKNRNKKTFKNVKTEREIVEERIKKNGIYYVKLVKALDFLLKGRTTKKQLLSYILPTIKKNNLKIERLMRRNKQIIYCWICENINFFPDLKSIITATWPYEENLDKYKTEDIEIEIDSDSLNDILYDDDFLI